MSDPFKHTLRSAIVAGAVFMMLLLAPEDRGEPTELPASQDAQLLFIGDIMLDRNVRLLMERDGANYPFVEIGTWLQSFDKVVGNLEGPIVPGTPRALAQSMKFSFRKDTEMLLKKYNITVVSLANNHTIDQGEEGYQGTRRELDEILAVGHPLYAAYAARTSVRGVAFRFVAFNATYPTFSLETAKAHIAEDTSADWTIVLVHWGDEYELRSNETQQQIAQALIDAGANIVIGTHPHVTQEIERYGSGIIFYSLGNFIFDQYFSKDVEEGLAVAGTFSKDSVTFTLFPIHGNHSQPKRFAEEEGQLWLKEFSGRSQTLQERVARGVLEIRR